MNQSDSTPLPIDTANTLAVFDCLEVGPIKLEPKRLIAPYTLHRNGKTERTELIYRYEEAVFKLNEPTSENLADMIAAQVAVNYGLFCRRIVFHGTFDEIDRRFIRDVMENTAREIYVKKFIEPNRFLTGPATKLVPQKKDTYLNAELQFPPLVKNRKKHQWQLWSTAKNRHCVLSSGGKDSLLTFGLLNEIGRETHPVFVNESGRHWFTALNAYRHFKARIPNTSRVWVNSDRLFTWMLQRMPFIRKNFTDVRSDDYPIRLWTVAVFLFGALPLMRKRGIARLLIGDEFDTSVRKKTHGIPHYDGLYDQSIYFDNQLSRYFMRKGWNVSQTSVLRPLSELMIEKILSKRYPDLQALQVSCHAARKDDARVYPCGKCEKCRRIISMLSAIGVDPAACGYQNFQIAACLKGFYDQELSQEQAAVKQLGFMLREQGLIGATGAQRKMFKARPEILKLRFDTGHSPTNSIPVDLREPLWRIFLQYTDGAVRREKKQWVVFNPLDNQILNQPFPFEIHESLQGHFNERTTNGDNSLWGELTWPEAKKRLAKIDVALLPVGAIEQHGPHLPLDTDFFDAGYLAGRVAEACSNPKPLVLPTLPYGISYHHVDFQGTISISNETLANLVYDIGISVSRNGVNKLVIINGHGGNSPALNYAAQMINRDARIFVCVDTGETSDVDIAELIETPNDVHAGEIETSTSLAVRPQLVKMDLAKKSIPRFSNRYLDFTSKRSILWYAYTQKISSNGIMGDPTRADAQKGKKIWEIMIAHLVALVEDLKVLTLEEIYHRNY